MVRQKKSVPFEVSPSDLPKRWVTTEQAAAYLSVSVQTIRSILHRGEIPAARLNPRAGGFHIDLSDLDRWLERKKKVVAPYRKNTRPHVRSVRPWEYRRDRKKRSRRVAS